MKRLILCMLSGAVMLSSLCGCALKRGFYSTAHGYLVSALGFDETDGRLIAFMETVIINSEDADAEKKNELLSGKGSTPKEALQSAAATAAEPVELSHCAVAVIGESVSPESFSEICDYLYGEKGITLSILLVSAQNAETLLSCSTVSSVAVGYDIMNMEAQQSRLCGIDYKNRFYELEAKREGEVNVIAIPFFETDGNSFYLNGMTVYKNDSAAMRLDRHYSTVYALAAGIFGTGNVILNEKVYDIESACSKISVTDEEKNAVKLEVKLKTNDEELKEALKEEIKKLFSLSQQKKLDLFGIGNTVYIKERDFFEKIKTDYDGFYENTELTVTVK